MMFRVVPVVVPNIDLRQFIGPLAADVVNAVDMKHIGPTEKFSELADDLLFKGFGERHLNYTFYVELPLHWDVIMGGFQFVQQFRRTCIANGLMIHGLITGPLDIWRALMLWIANDPNGQLLSHFAKDVMRTLPLNNDPDLRMLK